MLILLARSADQIKIDAQLLHLPPELPPIIVSHCRLARLCDTAPSASASCPDLIGGIIGYLAKLGPVHLSLPRLRGPARRFSPV